MGKVVCFGEIMMRLNPEGYKRFVQASAFEASYAGGEANVAVSLANYGIPASYVTKVPAHEIGQCAVNELRRFGVDTESIVRGGPRLGIYFCEKGASQRGSKVIYDRAGSSIALAKREDFDWGKILEGADWFHFTGITPALGGELPEICLDALKMARARGIRVSCDLNYRKKLWSRERAGEVMAQLMPYVDVMHRQRGGRGGRVRHPRRGYGRERGRDQPRGVHFRGAPAFRAVWRKARGHHAARQHFRQRKRLGGHAV